MTPAGEQSGGEPERRPSTRTSSRLPAAVANDDDSYQPNTGLFFPEDDLCVSLPVSPLTPTLPTSSPLPSSSSTSVTAGGDSNPPPSTSTAEADTPEKQRPCSVAKLPDHLTLRQPLASESERSRLPPAHHYGLSAAVLPSSGSSGGPSHAYGMFQNTVPVEETPEISQVVPDAAVHGGYRRPIDSVSTDMMSSIGQPDDLPPYTRYPEDPYARPPNSDLSGRAAAATSAAPAASAAAAAAALALTPLPAPSPGLRLTIRSPPTGAGGIGLATLDPEHDLSTDHLATPGPSPIAGSPSTGSRLAINNHQAIVPMEKPPGPGGWKGWAQKRIAGVIPYWAALLAAATLIAGITLGVAIGVYLGNRGDGGNDDSSDSGYEAKPQAIYGSDVVALTTLPDGFPPIETGRYTLSPLIMRNAPSACFMHPAQTQAWSCHFPYALYYLDIEKLPDKPNTTDYALSLVTYDHRNNTAMPKYPWGAAPPVFDTPTTMQLVIDTFEAHQGPAWWARITYNKTVIIGEDRMASTLQKRMVKSQRRRRSSNQVSDGDTTGDANRIEANEFYNGVSLGAVKGDKPWICTWPNTVLEVYIYPKQQSNPDHSPPSRRHARDDQSTYWPSYLRAVSQRTPPTTTITSAATAEPSWLPFDGVPVKPELYTKVFKFKERRIPELGSSTATCRQVRITDGGHNDTPELDTSGHPIEVTITEIPDGDGTAHELASRSPLTADDELTDCGCLWWVF